MIEQIPRETANQAAREMLIEHKTGGNEPAVMDYGQLWRAIVALNRYVVDLGTNALLETLVD